MQNIYKIFTYAPLLIMTEEAHWQNNFFSWVTNNQTGDIKHLAKKPLTDNPVCWSPSQWELRNWDGTVTRAAAASVPGAEAE